MGLMKAARGLPKYVMECGFWRHRSWTGAGLAAIGLQGCGISYCYEHETDGRLPGPDVEDLAAALGLRPREVRPALQTLLERGRWIEHEDGFEIVGYLDHNPSSAELRQHRQKRSSAGRRAAEARWKPDASAEHTEPDNDRQSDPHANRIRHRNARGEEKRAEEEPLGPAAPAETNQRSPDPIFDAVAAACGWPLDELTDDARGRLNAAAKQLRTLDATAGQVAVRARRYRHQYPNAALTPQALTGNWAALAAESTTRPQPSTILGRGVDAEPVWAINDDGCAVRADPMTTRSDA